MRMFPHGLDLRSWMTVSGSVAERVKQVRERITKHAGPSRRAEGMDAVRTVTGYVQPSINVHTHNTRQRIFEH